MHHFSFAYSTGDHPTIVWKTVVTAAVVKGMALVLTTGKVDEAEAADVLLFGIAGADGDVGDVIPVYAGDRYNVFSGQVDNADITASALPLACDLVEVSGEHRVDIGATSTQIFYVIESFPEDSLDDTTNAARVYFQILRSSYDLIVAAA